MRASLVLKLHFAIGLMFSLAGMLADEDLTTMAGCIIMTITNVGREILKAIEEK